MAKHGHFGPDFLRFLADLREHNDREWFLAHKDRYETAVRDPFLRFVADLGPLLRKLKPPFAADPSPVGGSMMRIYRDVRFSRDKSPYKTAVAAHFRHANLKNESAPALYLHLEPGKSSIGGGIWRPEPPMAKKIRDSIVREPKRWRRIALDRRLKSTYAMTGESLKRPPRGYDADDPLADDLKRKDFIVGSRLADRQITSHGFIEFVMDRYRTAMPFMQFLAESVGR
jgi:uncharacterized protein (TIGR02453 family)